MRVSRKQTATCLLKQIFYLNNHCLRLQKAKSRAHLHAQKHHKLLLVLLRYRLTRDLYRLQNRKQMAFLPNLSCQVDHLQQMYARPARLHHQESQVVGETTRCLLREHLRPVDARLHLLVLHRLAFQTHHAAMFEKSQVDLHERTIVQLPPAVETALPILRIRRIEMVETEGQIANARLPRMNGWLEGVNLIVVKLIEHERRIVTKKRARNVKHLELEKDRIVRGVEVEVAARRGSSRIGLGPGEKTTVTSEIEQGQIQIARCLPLSESHRPNVGRLIPKKMYVSACCILD